MKLKYYLRGLGVGIVFASSILIITYSIKYNRSGIIEKAKELGMDFVEETTTSKEENTKNTSSSKETIKQEESTTIEDSTSVEPTTETVTTEEATKPTEEVTKPTEQETTIIVSGDKITFSVVAGMSSDRVAKVLEEAGLIEDWYSYNEYLVENGYARRIRIGTYTVDKNISDKDLAEVITKGIQ